MQRTLACLVATLLVVAHLDARAEQGTAPAPGSSDKTNAAIGELVVKARSEKGRRVACLTATGPRWARCPMTSRTVPEECFKKHYANKVYEPMRTLIRQLQHLYDAY